MTFSYFPGCTLKTRGKQLDIYGRRAFEALGVELQELPEWQCCGAVYPMARDEIATRLSSVRALASARDLGNELVTLCSACHHVIKRVNGDMKNDEVLASRVQNYLKLETPYADIRFYNYDNNPVSGIYIWLDMTKDCWDDTSNVSSAVPAEYDDAEFINAYTLPDFAVESTVLSAKLSMTVQDMVDAGWTIERRPDYIPANSAYVL